MFGPGKDQQRFLENLGRVVGPVQQLNAVSDPGDWCFSARYRDREVRVALTAKGYVLSGVSYQAPLTVPARLHVDGHYASYSHAPVVATGDAEFDRVYKVHGLPPEVVAGVLDARTRRWFLDTYGERPPQTDTQNGWLGVHRNYRHTHDTFELPLEAVPSSQEIAHFLDVSLDLVDRIAIGFHATKAAIAKERGPAAAEQWAAAQAQALAGAARAQAKLRKIVLGVVAAIVVVPLVAIVIFVLVIFLRQ